MRTLDPAGNAAASRPFVWRAALALFWMLFAIGPFGAAAAQSPANQAETTPVPVSPRLDAGRSGFVFGDWAGPQIRVWTYIPEGTDARIAPIAIILHGVDRDAVRYREEWIEQADAYGFIVVAPEFDQEQFPRANGYNLGAMTEARSDRPRDESLWSFSAIEPMFDAVVARLGGTQAQYTLYGHSAGSQFVHRFLFMKPGARAKRFIPANAGWYSFPDLAVAYPFGLGGLSLDETRLRAALEQDVVVLLGNQDTDRNYPSLNRTRQAMRQGPHRFARGQAFFESARALAEENGWRFGWSLQIVDGVAHSNAEMGREAAKLIE